MRRIGHGGGYRGPHEDDKKKVDLKGAWSEARALLWAHRKRLVPGFFLMVANRLAGLVLPASSKYLIDEVIGNNRVELLAGLAFAVGGATLVQAASSFALSQVLGVAAQRAITDMRKVVQEHVARLPINYYDSTKAGILISRVMTDAEGIRNLVGTGLVQLIGGLMTATIGLFVLFYVNWRLTSFTIIVLLLFAGAMAMAFTRLRPLFRERGKLNADVTGRLGETFGGIRIVKAYTAERREEYVFAKGVHRLFRNVAKAVTGVSAISSFSTLVVGGIGVIIITVGGRSIISGAMTLGDLVLYIFFTGLVATPLIQIASIEPKSVRRLRGWTVSVRSAQWRPKTMRTTVESLPRISAVTSYSRTSPLSMRKMSRSSRTSHLRRPWEPLRPWWGRAAQERVLSSAW